MRPRRRGESCLTRQNHLRVVTRVLYGRFSEQYQPPPLLITPALVALLDAGPVLEAAGGLLFLPDDPALSDGEPVLPRADPVLPPADPLLRPGDPVPPVGSLLPVYGLPVARCGLAVEV
jgi:hypothetical protein